MNRRWALPALAMVVLGAVALGMVACGGDDDDTGSSGPTDAGTGSAEDYVAVVCAATNAFADSVLALSEDFIDSEDPPEAKVFLEPFDTYLKAMAKAKPPADLKAYHTQLVAAGRSVEALLKKGDLEAALAGEPFPDPPADQLDKLAAIAATNDDCMASGTFVG